MKECKLIDIPDCSSLFLLILLKLFPISVPLCTPSIPKAREENSQSDKKENTRYVGYHTNFWQPSNVPKTSEGKFKSVHSAGLQSKSKPKRRGKVSLLLSLH